MFENISEKSGINASKGWATGVTFADVNNDGWQDLAIQHGLSTPDPDSDAVSQGQGMRDWAAQVKQIEGARD